MAVGAVPAAKGLGLRTRQLLLRMTWWREVLLLVTWYELYELGRRLTPAHPRLALAHARGVMSLENHLHIGVERSINEVFAQHGWLGAAAGYWYALAHFVVTVGVLIWLYLRRPNLYRSARTILVLASVAAIVVFWLYPVAPPRLAESGLIDTNVVHNIFGVAHAEKSGGFVNIYAAVHSLHAGWAIWVAATLTRAFPRSKARLLIWLYPLTTILVVLGTANHYLVDVIAGGAAVALAGLYLRLVHPALIRAEADDVRMPARVVVSVRRPLHRPMGGPRSQHLLLGPGSSRQPSRHRP